MKAGEAVGDDLGCGLGCSFGGGFRLCLLGCGPGGFRGGGSDSEILPGLLGEVGLGAGDDEDLLKLREVGGGADPDGGVGLVVWIGSDGLDGADGETARVNLVAAGGEDLLAGLDAGVGGEIADLQAAVWGAAQDGADAGGGEQDAGAGGLVVEKEDLRRVGEDVAELADYTVGSNDSHVGL